MALAHVPCTSSHGPCTGPYPKKMNLFGCLSGIFDGHDKVGTEVNLAIGSNCHKGPYFNYVSTKGYLVGSQNDWQIIVARGHTLITLVQKGTWLVHKMLGR